MEEDKKISLITDKDLVILQKLIEDGRKSSSSISKEIDLGREIVNYRIKRLIKENLIVKFIPKINSDVLRYSEYVILLKLNLKDDTSKNKIIKETIGNKYLIWSIKSNNGWDIIIRLYCQSVDEFKIKLKEILQNFQNIIAKYYTIMSIEEIKEDEKKLLIDNFFKNNMAQKDFKKIKVNSSKVVLDLKDKEILKMLEDDARANYSKISTKLDISSDTVKYRIDKMIEKGVIENFNPIINFSKLGFSQAVIIVKFNYLDELNKDKFENFLKNKTCVIKAIKSLNMEEFFINLVSKDKKIIENIKNEIEKNYSKDIDSCELFLLE